MPHVPITTLAGIASLTDCEWHTDVFQTHCHSSVSSSSVKCQAEIFCLNRCKFVIAIAYSVYCLIFPLLFYDHVSCVAHTCFSPCLSLFLIFISSPPHLCPFNRLPLFVSVLNQLPLPSPLPATTTKSLLYNGRIAEEVTCLLGCRDENLASQLAHGLNQVSTEHMWVYTRKCQYGKNCVLIHNREKSHEATPLPENGWAVSVRA